MSGCPWKTTDGEDWAPYSHGDPLVKPYPGGPLVCRRCARDYALDAAEAEGHGLRQVGAGEVPYYADTMTGGVVYLGSG